MNKLYYALLFMIVGLSMQAMEPPVKRRKISSISEDEENKHNKPFFITLANNSDELIEMGKVFLNNNQVVVKDQQRITPGNSTIVPYTQHMYIANGTLKSLGQPLSPDTIIASSNGDRVEAVKIVNPQQKFTILPYDHAQKNLFKPNHTYTYCKENLRYNDTAVYFKYDIQAIDPYTNQLRFLQKKFIPLPSPLPLIDLCLLYVANENLPTNRLPQELKEKIEEIKE